MCCYCYIQRTEPTTEARGKKKNIEYITKRRPTTKTTTGIVVCKTVCVLLFLCRFLENLSHAPKIIHTEKLFESVYILGCVNWERERKRERDQNLCIQIIYFIWISCSRYTKSESVYASCVLHCSVKIRLCLSYFKAIFHCISCFSCL